MSEALKTHAPDAAVLTGTYVADKIRVLTPLINIPLEIDRMHGMGLLEPLLFDRTTRHNITWATDTYTDLGEKYEASRQITSDLIIGDNSGVIKARAAKSREEQTERTRKKGEVFTPTWVCKKMCDHGEEVIRESVKDWKGFVDSRQLEITCGEAPFLASRYDTQSGEIIPIKERIGLLDRKLREVAANTSTEGEWLFWARRAYEATYGYEFQGDNLLIARINMMMSFFEYFEECFGHSPEHDFALKLATVISWNLWQMNGLTGHVPVGVIVPKMIQMSLFEAGEEEAEQKPVAQECLVYDWRANHSQPWRKIGGR